MAGAPCPFVLDFLWDGDRDTKDAIVTAPDDVPVEGISLALRKKHGELDSSGGYFEAGRNPETLLDETCRENGWAWEETGFDLVMELD